MRIILLFVLLVSLVDVAYAHRDTWLSLSFDGAIPELPARYSGTRVKIQMTEGGTGGLEMLSFTSSGQQTGIKPCLLKLVRSTSLKQVSMTGSWYHTRSQLPHYVSILFRDPDGRADLPEPPGVQFLFSLEDGNLLEVTRIVGFPKEQAVQIQRIKLKKGCPGGK